MRGSRLPQKILMEIVVRRFPKRYKDFSPPLLKQLLKNCRPCSVQNQQNSQQILFLSQSEKFMGFFLAAPIQCWWSSHSLPARVIRGGGGAVGDKAYQPCETAQFALLLNTSHQPTYPGPLCWNSKKMLYVLWICSMANLAVSQN